MGGQLNELIPWWRVVNRRRQIEHIMWVLERPDHHCGDDLVCCGENSEHGPLQCGRYDYYRFPSLVYRLQKRQNNIEYLSKSRNTAAPNIICCCLCHHLSQSFRWCSCCYMSISAFSLNITQFICVQGRVELTTWRNVRSQKMLAIRFLWSSISDKPINNYQNHDRRSIDRRLRKDPSLCVPPLMEMAGGLLVCLRSASGNSLLWDMEVCFCCSFVSGSKKQQQ